MMLTRLREGRRIRRLAKDAEVVHESFVARLRDAKFDGEKRDRLIHDSLFEASLYEDQIAEIRSDRLVQTALKLSLPVPFRLETSDYWRLSSTIGSWALTNHGTNELRKAIRHERRERREVWQAWTGMVVSVLSLVVAILALLVASHWFEGPRPVTSIEPLRIGPGPTSSQPTHHRQLSTGA